MVKVSVIVPAYNAGRTLAECVESVLTQTHDNLEVLIIDDGSTDCTPDICEKLQNADKRIAVTRQKNLGVSAARNAGLRQATGKYVLMVDSDDRLKPHIIAGTVSLAETQQADLVIFGFDFHMMDTGEIRSNAITENFCGSPQVFFERWFPFIVERELFNPPWNKLILRSMIVDNRLCFNTRYSICEDMAFSADVLRTSAKTVLYDGSGYEYRLHASGSLVFRFYDNYFEALCHYYARAMAYCNRFANSTRQVRLVNTTLINLSIMYFKRIYQESGWGRQRKEEKVTEICNHPYFRRALRASDSATCKKAVVRLLARARCYHVLNTLYRVACPPQQAK